MERQDTTSMVSVVIPAFNESDRIRGSIIEVCGVLEAICATPDWEVIVADDGSTDATATIVRELMMLEPRLSLLSLPHRGKGATVRSGILAANGEKILFSDADLATPMREAARLFAELEAGADVAIGSRAAPGAQRLGEPFYREAMGAVFRSLVHLLLLSDFCDTQCGFKAFSRRAAHDVFSRLTLHTDDSPVITHAAVTAFDLEVLYLAVHLGYRVREVPVEWHYGAGSKVNPLRDSLALLRDVLEIRSRVRRGVYDLVPDLPITDPASPLPLKDDPHVAG